MSEKFSPKSLLYPFRNFPFTLGAIWLFTFILIWNLFFYTSDSELLISVPEYLLLILFYFGSGSFFIESLFLRRERNKWFYLALLVNTACSFLFFFLSHVWDLERWRANSWSTLVLRYSVCYFLIMFFSAVRLCYKSLPCSLEEYLILVFGRTVRYHLIWMVLMIGTTLVFGILDALFQTDSDLHLQSQMLIFGLYFMSSFLLSFYPQDTADNVLISVLIKYILSGMVIIAFGIIYLYLGKILILLEIPSNSIFRITGQLFILGMPVCLMSSFYQENNPFHPIIRYLPCFFLPFLPLQAFSIGIRILHNGITPLRYAAVFFLIFECFFFVVYFFRRPRLHDLFLLLAFLILTGGCLPFVNMNYVSYLSQKTAIDRFLALSDEEKQPILTVHYNDSPEDTPNWQLNQRVHGAYSFLSYDYLGKKYLATLSEQDIEYLEALSSYADPYDPQTHYHTSASVQQIPVEGYRYCYPFETASYRSSYEDLDTSEEKQALLASYPLLPDVKPQLTADLDTLLRSYMKQADNTGSIEVYFASHRIYKIDGEHVLYLNMLSFTYDHEADLFTSFRIEGYLLEKQ